MTRARGLAHGLGARDQADRAAAVDALLILAGRRQLDGPALGTEPGALAALDMLQLGRVVPALRDAARSGAAAEVWAIVTAAVPGMLPPAVGRPPRGLPGLKAELNMLSKLGIAPLYQPLSRTLL